MKRKVRIGVGALVAALSLAGCSRNADRIEAVNLLISGPSPSLDAASVNKIAQEQNGIVEGIWKIAGYAQPPSNPNWEEFGRAAFDLADRQCHLYLSNLRLLEIARRQTVKEINLVGAATAAILGIAKSASASIAITATAFGLLESTIDNYAGSLIYELPASTIINLVEQTKDSYEEKIKPANWVDRTSTFRTVRGYMELCTPVMIEGFVKSAVDKTKVKANQGANASGGRIRVQITE